jgi:putative DNA primase/helicase
MTETKTTTDMVRVVVNPDGIPDRLKVRPQWVNWRYEERDGKLTKVPYTPAGRKASSTDLMTWSTFEKVLDAFESGKHDGVGFVFCSGDPFAGVDLDSCRDSETGELEEWAAEIVQKLGGYAEASPSGKGVHIIVLGKAPNKKRGKVEAYSSERFFTMTGRAL